MKLEPKIAKTIVENLKDIVHHEINLFDTNGVIIASTDEKRIGTIHDGALKVVMNREPVIIHSDEQFDGARKGTNLPILFNDSVIAVIGITGEPAEVEPLGNIIKKMTEILIRENSTQLTRFNRQNNYNSLVSMLTSTEKDESLIAYLLSILEIKKDVPRRVIIGNFFLLTE